jgi:hypothetical protein
MTAGTPTASTTPQDITVEEKISQLHELFADAPDVSKIALKNLLSRLASDASKALPPPVESAGRVGSRLPDFLDIIACELTANTLGVDQSQELRMTLRGSSPGCSRTP